MATPVGISNKALSRVGIRARIPSMSEASEEARVCNLHYDDAVKHVLAQHPWPFAQKRFALALIEERPNTEWLFRYALPVDCIEPTYIEGAARNLPVDMRPRFILESDDTADRTTLLSDEPNPVLKYTSSLISPGVFPIYFEMAVVWVLADLICFPLSVKEELAQRVVKMAEFAVMRAMAHASNQGQADEELPSEFETVRN